MTHSLDYISALDQGHLPELRSTKSNPKREKRQEGGKKTVKDPILLKRLRHRGPKQFLMIRQSQADKRTPHIHKPGFL